MFKKDTFFTGFILGILLPAAIFALFFLVDHFTGWLSNPPLNFSIKKQLFVSGVLNVIPIRYFFIRAHHTDTGKGLLFITVVIVLLTVILVR